ncbi:MAG: tetratricopeptide repeat protein [Deltaproteobacteria bacterium]|nr:tetratricopeptide repeat protein [Deltaproteobacteria bacterium]
MLHHSKKIAGHQIAPQKEAPQTGKEHRALAKEYSERRDQDKAIKQYSRALELNPADKLALNGRGWSYFKEGRYKIALKDFDQLVSLSKNAKNLHSRAIALHYLHRYDESIADLTEAVNLAPRNAEILRFRTVTNASAGNYDATVADLRQLYSLDPKRADMTFKEILLDPNFRRAYQERILHS